MKLWDKSYLKAVPLIVLLLGMFLYKFRYTLRLVKPTQIQQEAIDSSYLYRKDYRPTVSHGYLMGREFNGIDLSKYPIKQNMDSGMDMLSNDQFYIIKLYDEKNEMQVYVAIRDLTLLSKIPFSLSFETGEKILVTAFIKNKSGVNAMYGGTIHNNRGKLRLTGYSRSTNLISGEIEADLDAVIENGVCDIRNLKFSNVILQHNKVN